MSNPPAVPSPADLHEDQIIALLRSGAHAALLSAYFGEVEYRELAQLAKIAAMNGANAFRTRQVSSGVSPPSTQTWNDAVCRIIRAPDGPMRSKCRSMRR